MDQVAGPPYSLSASSAVDWTFVRDVVNDPEKSVVLIIEHPSGCTRLFAALRTWKARIIVVATSPGVCWECEKNGIAWKGVEWYYNPDALFSLGMSHYPRVDALCRRIDDNLQERMPVLQQYGFRPAGDRFFPIKMLYDGLTMRIAILRQILDSETPDLVLTFYQYADSDGQDPWEILPFGYAEGIYALVLSLGGWGIPWATMEMNPSEGGGTHRGVFAESVLSMAGHLVFLVQSEISRLRRRTPLLLVGHGYDWDCAAPILSREGFGIIHHHWKWQRNRCRNDERIVLAAGSIESDGIFMGIDMTPLLLERLERILGHYLLSVPVLLARFEGAFRHRPPMAVLFGTKAIGPDHILARLAKHYGIPVVSWQHGAQGTSEVPMMMYYEIMNSDRHLCFGTGVESFYGMEAWKRYGCRMVPVGSCEIDRISRQGGRGGIEFDLLYATTNYYLNFLYIGGLSHTTFQDNDLWETQKRILDLLGASGRKCAFKLHPGQYQEKHIREYLKVKGYANIRMFRNERDFSDLAWHSRAIILDCASTTLIQAAATDRPIFLLTRHTHLTEHAGELAAKRVSCFEDLADMVARIERHLREGGNHSGSESQNSEFLEQFGTGSGDGNPAERAVSVLEELRSRDRHSAQGIAEKPVL